MSHLTPPRFRARTGITLVELILALTLITILSTAITALLQGAARSNEAINAMATSQWEVELALRRMIEETRVAQQNTVSVAGSTTYSFTSESDASNNSATYIFTYYQAATSATDSTPALWEQKDSNPPGANPLSNAILIHNLQSGGFSVQQTTVNSRILLNITVSAGTSTPTTRSISIAPRN